MLCIHHSKFKTLFFSNCKKEKKKKTKERLLTLLVCLKEEMRHKLLKQLKSIRKEGVES